MAAKDELVANRPESDGEERDVSRPNIGHAETRPILRESKENQQDQHDSAGLQDDESLVPLGGPEGMDEEPESPFVTHPPLTIAGEREEIGGRYFVMVDDVPTRCQVQEEVVVDKRARSPQSSEEQDKGQKHQRRSSGVQWWSTHEAGAGRKGPDSSSKDIASARAERRLPGLRR